MKERKKKERRTHTHKQTDTATYRHVLVLLRLLEGLSRVKRGKAFIVGKLSKQGVHNVNRALYMLNTYNVNGKRAERKDDRETERE